MVDKIINCPDPAVADVVPAQFELPVFGAITWTP